MGVQSTTLGIQVPVFETRVFSIQFFSTEPTAEWTVFAEDTSAAYGGTQLLGFTPNPVSGKNGDVVSVEVQALAAGPNGGTEFILYSYRGESTSFTNYWFGFVQN